MANEIEVSQLHPGVYSSIRSSQDSYAIADGIITAFSADVFKKGIDGDIQFVSTSSEFISKYGEPDNLRYGQSGYNIIKFLENGGNAYVMRLLPKNATFAHAVINVQTKVTTEGKKVRNSRTGEIVKIDDVMLRSTASFIKKNNTNIDILLTEVDKDRSSQNTVDGYENNFVMMFYPEGRGSFYNDLGFRLVPSTSYEVSTGTKIYQFEVVQFEDDDNMELVEGPFYVSFDKDAITTTGESMFIEDVINSYSQHIKCKFNMDAFLKVANTINPNVNPNQIDILTGQTGLDETGSPKTYYDEHTLSEEDIHISLHKYNSNGNLVTQNGEPVLNIPSYEDAVEKALITLDNSLREEDYKSQVNRLDYMKNMFPKLSDSNFASFKLDINRIYTPADGSTAESGEIIKSFNENLIASTNGTKNLIDGYNDQKKTYAQNPNENNLSILSSYMDSISILIRNNIFDLANQIYAGYSLTERTSPTPQLPAKYALDIDKTNAYLNKRDKVSIFTVQHQKKIADIIEEIDDYRLGIKSGTKEEGASVILDLTETEMKYVYESLLPVAYDDYSKVPKAIIDEFDADNADSATAKYNKVLKLLEDIENGYIVETANNMDSIYSASSEICNTLIDIINKATYESGTKAIEGAIESTKTNILEDVKTFRKSIMIMITPNGTYDAEAIVDNARQRIDIESAAVVTSNSKYFNTNLLNFSTPIKLLLGSDGDFEYDLSNLTERRNNIKNTIIQAYKGNVNSNVNDKKLYPFDIVFDACYHDDIKIAISEFVTTARGDCQFFADTISNYSFPVTPAEVINWKRSKFTITSRHVSLFSQDFEIYDSFTGRDIRFSPANVLAGKVAYNADQYGTHQPMAGPRRGIIEGIKGVQWYPNEAYSEKLYNEHINYFEYDNSVTKLGSQSTTLRGNGALSTINNMFTLLKLRRGAEEICSNFIFEFNDDETTDALYSVLNDYFDKYVSNRSCESITCEISASEYDRKQRLLRVKVGIKFIGVIERISLEFTAG